MRLMILPRFKVDLVISWYAPHVDYRTHDDFELPKPDFLLINLKKYLPNSQEFIITQFFPTESYSKLATFTYFVPLKLLPSKTRNSRETVRKIERNHYSLKYSVENLLYFFILVSVDYLKLPERIFKVPHYLDYHLHIFYDTCFPLNFWKCNYRPRIMD